MFDVGDRRGGRRLTNDCGRVEIVVEEVEMTAPRPTFAVRAQA